MVSLIIIIIIIVSFFTSKNKAFLIHQQIIALVAENDGMIDRTTNNNYVFDVKPYNDNNDVIVEGFGLDDIKDTFEKPVNDIKDAILKPINAIRDFVRTIERAFNSIPSRARNFGAAFDYAGKGIKLQFINLGKSLKIGFNDIFNLIGKVGNCGIKTIENFRSCVIWYILDLIGTTMYNTFITLPIFLIRMLTGFNLKPFVDIIHNYLEIFDTYFFRLTCYHIFHYPDWVIEQCYSCDYQDEIKQINFDWKTTIPRLLKAPSNLFLNSEAAFKLVFT